MQNKKSLFHRITAIGVAVLLTCVMAFATITPLVVVTLKQNNYAVVAGDLNLTPAAMDAVNGNSFTATGKEVLLFINTDTVTHTVTVTSTSDSLGRLDTSLTTYTVPVAVGGLSGLAAVEMTNMNGWIQSGQTVNMTTSSALVKISVLRHQ
jgi:hypothetical protein